MICKKLKRKVMNIQHLIALGGMIGPILYSSIWILGGILQPDYIHIRARAKDKVNFCIHDNKG
jgi:hypothetical protein